MSSGPGRGPTDAGPEPDERLDAVAQTWESLGTDDPLWAVLTVPGSEGGRWDLDEFFATGDDEVAELMRRLRELGYPRATHRALDFGCGVGRLTQALARVFDEVVGVDVAASMLAEAQRLNRSGDRVRWVHNAAADLAVLGDERFDCVYTSYVLQHMDPVLARAYIAEFIRVLAPGGIAVFQIPVARLDDLDRVAWPDAARRAWCALSSPPQRLGAGTRCAVDVVVGNASSQQWDTDRTRMLPVNVGNHWSAPDGAVVVGDDGRAPVARDLAPHEHTTVRLDVTAPDEPGRYVLEVDVVQEGVAWFAESPGSATARCTVDVVAADAAPLEPVHMDMHVIADDEVRSVVAAAGGEVVTATGIFAAYGDLAAIGFDHRCYFVTRRD